MPAVVRLFELYRLNEQLTAETITGADPETGEDMIRTDVINARTRVATECRMLESQLGLSPRSRLALGLALLAGRKAGSLDDASEDAND